MIHYKYFVLVTVLLLSAYSAKAGAETRKLEPFSHINVAVAAQVYLEPAGSQYFEIEGDDEFLEQLITEVKDGKLHIKLEKPWQNKRWKTSPIIRIGIPMLDELKVTGSGEVQTENAFKNRDLKLMVTGSGKISMPVATDSLELMVTGSGDMDLQGKATSSRIKITGSGKINAGSLIVKSCEVRISGSGDCQIHTEDSLLARISGSGKVLYKGAPRELNVHSSGSGKVMKAGE